MLVLSRRKDEEIVFPGLGIKITVVEVRGDKVRLGIEAPREVTIHRKEVADAIRDHCSDIVDGASSAQDTSAESPADEPQNGKEAGGLDAG